jgi:hypothetical protein
MDIYEYEEEFIPESECEDRKYYLSVVAKDTDGELIMDYRVDPKIFFNFSYQDVIEYAKTTTQDYYSQNLEIVQVVFKGDRYTAIIKTYWLKIVQRAWKKYMNEKKTWIANIKQNILRIIQLTKNLPPEPQWKGSICQT